MNKGEYSIWNYENSCWKHKSCHNTHMVIMLLLFSCSVLSNSWPHGLQHARLHCPPLSPRVWSNSCPLSQWCYLAISSSVALSPFAFNLSQHQGLFQWVSSLHQAAEYWSFSFSISPSNEYSLLTSFRVDWFDLLAVQGTLKDLLQHHNSKNINSSVLRFLYGPILTSIHDY